MKELARTARPTHPLVEDRARLDKITDNMAAQIHRVIYGRSRDPRNERVLHGGESADDVLQDAAAPHCLSYVQDVSSMANASMAARSSGPASASHLR